MKKSISALFLTLFAVGLMTGCNSNNNNNPGAGANCGAPPGNFQVLYPKPNALHVNPNINTVYVAANPSLPSGNSFNFFVVQTNGNQQYTNTFATYPGAIPNPHASPAAGSTVYQTNFSPSLPIGPLQSVNLYWNDGGSGCQPNVIVSTFSTQ